MTYGLVGRFSSRVPTFSFQNLNIGAGGAIIGLDIATDGTRLIRTDTFGAYTWNGTKWSQVVTAQAMPSGDVAPGSGKGVYEVAIAPSNTSHWYMIYNGYVYTTTNKGGAWTRTALAQDTTANENDNYRTFYTKMCVDPQNENVVFVTTPTAGVSYTLNGGTSWTTVATSQIAAATGGIGYNIAFDPNSSVVSSQKQGLYCMSNGHGVYHSTNAGITWTLTTSGPTTCSCLTVNTNGVCYVADSVTGVGLGQAWAYTGTWAKVGTATDVACLAFDPANPTHIYGIQSFNSNLYISTNGTSWNVAAPTSGITFAGTDIPWIAYTQTGRGASGACNCKFDPSLTNTMLSGGGLGLSVINPPTTNTSITFTDQSLGIEQLVSNGIVVPQAGTPVVAVWDDQVFQSVSNAFPSRQATQDTTFAAAWAVDCPLGSSPSTVVALINWNGTEVSAISNNYGASWTKFSTLGTFPPFQSTTGGNIGGYIAASSATNFVMVRTDNGSNPNQPYYTTNGGTSWTAITMAGVPTSGSTGWNSNYSFNAQMLCSDRVDASTFYIYNQGTGTWKSTNGGASWTLVNSGGLPGSLAFNAQMKSVPLNSGNLFRTSGAFSGAVFQRSTDHATTWSTVGNITEVHSFGFGMPKPGGGGYPVIYIAGYNNSVWGFWKSEDNASTWTQLGTDGYPLGHWDEVQCMEGDMNVYGSFYTGFRGSAYIYGSIS